MRSNQKRKGSGRKTIVIVVDGETEIWYLNMMQRSEQLLGFNIKPELPRRKKLLDQYESVIDNSLIYDQVVWMLDLDVIIKENAIKEFGNYVEALKTIDNIHVLVNTPCLEFWFFQHVKDSGAYYSECQSVHSQLKRYDPLKDYEKSKRYFVSDGNDIYKRLRPFLSNAMANAKKRGDFDIEEPTRGKAEIYKLFDLLGLVIN